jgi:hypothetical protein
LGVITRPPRPLATPASRWSIACRWVMGSIGMPIRRMRGGSGDDGNDDGGGGGGAGGDGGMVTDEVGKGGAS